MTIALGILASDGVVIAADTQENIGALKVTTRKIFTRRDPIRGRAFAASGAGNSGYIDAINQRLARHFERANTPELAESDMSAALLAFYRDHLFPMNVVPARERPAVELISGMTWKGRAPILFASEDSTLHQAKDYAAVGAGSDFAMMLLDRIVSRKVDLSLELAGLLAAYVVFNVKEYMPDCGKGTHVTLLRDGDGKYCSEEAIQTMEQAFRLYLQFDGTAVNYLLGRPLKNEESERDRLVTRLETLRQQFQALPTMTVNPSWDLDWADSPRTPLSGGWTENILGRAVIKPTSTPGSRAGQRVRPRPKHGR
jgi:20S proteasome alpha/beta subunit